MNRRICAAFLILGVTLLLTLFSHFQIRQITAYTCSGLEEVRQASFEGDYPRAQQTLEEVLRYYSQKQHFLEFFIKRETVIATTVNLYGLKAYVNAASLSDLFSEIDKAQQQLQMTEHLFTAIV